ncbi:unnamed protein product [Symbiodinium sp. KB8]|nr:unnamed protein product [Symbiodinium sp. KB8]
MPVAEVREFHYPELQDFSAVLQIPWDFGLVSFQEVLALGLPVLLPSSHYMHALITTVFLARSNLTDWNEKWKRRFLQLVPDMWEGFVPPASNRTLGIAERSELRLVEQVSSWWRYTEFETNRWVKRFRNLADLNTLLKVLDPGALCARLRQETAYKLRQSLRFHQQLLTDVLQRK